MSKILDESALDSVLAGLGGWSYDPDQAAIRRDFRFHDFSGAFAFMARVALLAEKADHHPDLSNSYNRVSVALSTHSAGGVTAKDIALAEAINRLL